MIYWKHVQENTENTAVGNLVSRIGKVLLVELCKSTNVYVGKELII